MAIHLFGLTGGIASGKSTVAARFRERGLPVIDADQVARDVVKPGTEGLAAVVEAFGDGVLQPDGSLDRRKLASVAFPHPERRALLNSLLHPRIALRTRELATALEAEGHALACYEAALLVENGAAEAFRPLVVVALPEPLQVQRAMARDGCTEAEARARLAAQLPLADKVKVADFVIDSSGPRESTLAQADRVLDAIRRAG